MPTKFKEIRKEVYKKMQEIGWDNTNDKTLKFHLENLRKDIYEGDDKGEYTTCDMLVDDFGFICDFLEAILK